MVDWPPAGCIVEIPGINSQGETRRELVDNLRSALKEGLEIRRELSLASAPAGVEEQTVLV